MPYDEAMSGLTRAVIGGVSPRLLPFMAHDRVSLAGAMIAVGILFAMLAWCGVRRGQHWAERAVIVPAGVGFLSFFSFLGFGYFDPLHAFVTAILFQFLLLAIVGRASPLAADGLPDRDNDAAWRRGLWGQLGFIVHGAVVLLAGIVIMIIGMTTVFVREDLAYLQLCAADLAAVPGLVPLVAHDRGTFGGMLMVAGLTMLLAALWGFRRGAAWLWWTFVAAGSTGYLIAIAVHHAVGYVDAWHLAPAYAGLAALWLAAAASRDFLCGR
jgi:dihydroorotate dehydrogenase